ncbi:DUF4307 domain-containing protein [Microtetraspora fusca]|uniref:DUF4307 domain-containing protein n=1 Tax=Microtetraspora fusca TaxID=1997 RepID=A0ABW6V4N5_MICFU|nr:DUF4307 domain-containing protein [Microtetraspora fusca]
MAAESSSRSGDGARDAGDRTGAPVAAPILGTPEDFPERPRLQGRPRILAYVVISVLVAVIAGGWGYVMMAARGNPDVRGDVITYDASASDFAEFTFSVHKPADSEAICRLRAVDAGHTEVGSKEVTLPKGRSDLTLTDRLKTSSQATSVLVQYCDLV